eukprot:TRINITY_DN3726_c0_g1_i4.p1 TRINITY_DN3726_c0_g1~~TRINITY_DN3726_c0_g1_i4.p1  ORF type:complete len:910 (+),score=261.73 TRINITY_DN3726_c0_g1_i4:1-2730(+)
MRRAPPVSLDKEETVSDVVEYSGYSLYDILTSPHKCHYDTFKVGFQKNILLYQPHNKDDTLTNKKLVDLCRAYHVLCDPELKTEYDKTGCYKIHLPTYWTFQRLAEEGEIERLSKMLNENPDKLNEEDKMKHTALYVAARANRKEVVEFLIGRRADPDRKQRDGSTPLHAACYYGQVEIIKLLLEYGANPFVRNRHNLTPMEEIHGNFEAEVTVIAEPYLNSPWIAAKIGELELMQELIQNKNLNINARDNLQKTFLHCAAENNKLHIVEWLIQQQADINVQDQFSTTPLHLAAKVDSDQIIKCLFSHFANPSLPDSHNNTPEMLAHTTKYLFENQRKQSPEEMQNASNAWWFEYWYHPKGSEIDKRDSEGRTLLYKASKDGQEKIVSILIAKKANLDLTQLAGSSPLHAASYYGYPNIVQALLKAGANPSLQNGKGKTPLDEAAEGKNDSSLQQKISEILKQYMNVTSENTVPLFEVTFYERNNPKSAPVKIPLSLSSTFGEVIKVLDPNFVPPPKNPTSRFHKFNLPYKIFYGGRRIQVMSDLPVLQEISKARYSMSRVISFPIALEYEKIPDDETSLSFTETRNNLPPPFKAVIEITESIPPNWEKKMERALCGLRFTCTNAGSTLDILDGSSLPNCIVAFRLTSRKTPSHYFAVEVNDNGKDQRQFSLCLYDTRSQCWYEISTPAPSKKIEFVVPVPNGIYSIIHKEIILLLPSIQIPRDLLQDSYKSISPVIGTTFVKIRYELRVPTNFHEDEYFTAYHGTRSDRLASIVTNGLMVPNERNNAGTVVETKQETADPTLTHEGIPNWGIAIFLSLYEKYSRIPLYANPFKYIGKDKEYNDFDCHLYFEVKVDKTKPFTKHLNTTPVSSTFLSDEEKKTAEWRITDASSVFISAFVVVVRTKIVNQ